VAQDVYRLDDDFFLDRIVTERPASVEFLWHGALYRAEGGAADRDRRMAGRVARGFWRQAGR
jgi:hypothetical protein